VSYISQWNSTRTQTSHYTTSWQYSQSGQESTTHTIKLLPHVEWWQLNIYPTNNSSMNASPFLSLLFYFHISSLFQHLVAHITSLIRMWWLGDCLLNLRGLQRYSNTLMLAISWGWGGGHKLGFTGPLSYTVTNSLLAILETRAFGRVQALNSSSVTLYTCKLYQNCICILTDKYLYIEGLVHNYCNYLILYKKLQ